MVPVTTNLAEMMKSFSDVLPVDRLAKPTVFDELIPALLPVIAFDPAPLASPLLRVEMWRTIQVLGGGDNNVSFSSDPVPAGEVHRHYDIAISNGDSTARTFNLIKEYRNSSGAVFAQSLISQQSIIVSAIAINMLAVLFDSGSKPRSWNGVPLDLYPGASWRINNNSALTVATSYINTGVRLVYRGPSKPAAEEVVLNSSSS